MLQGIWTIVVAIIVFAIMIAIHEFGHFSAAKLFKIRVNQFAIGMGPVIWKKQGKETLYSLRAIPMGGFCQMEGEDEASDDERSFGKAAWWKRFIVVLAGAALNIVLGFIIFLILQAPTAQVNTTVIDSIDQTTNLAGSVFQPGDQITKIGGSTIHIYEDLRFALERVTDQPVEVTARRGNETVTQTITPVKQDIVYTYSEEQIDIQILHNSVEVDHQTQAAPDTEEYQDYIGKSGTQTSYILGFVPKAENMTFTTAISRAFYLTLYNIKIVYVSLYELIRGNVPASQVSGPGRHHQRDWPGVADGLDGAVQPGRAADGQPRYHEPAPYSRARRLQAVDHSCRGGDAPAAAARKGGHYHSDWVCTFDFGTALGNV